MKEILILLIIKLLIILIMILIMNMQNKLYKIQFFSPPDDQFTVSP